MLTENINFKFDFNLYFSLIDLLSNSFDISPLGVIYFAALGFFKYFDLKIIWVKIIRMGNKQFSCHFLSVFIVTWIQNEPSESQDKSTKLKVHKRE